MIPIKSTSMPVTGLTCTNCASVIEVKVRKLPGVIDANVDFASGKLSVNFDAALVSEKDIIAVVSRIGYGVATGKTELPVTGLQDNADALSLEKILIEQNGILAASVGYRTERVTLEYIHGMTIIAEIAAIIRKSGFDIVLSGDSEGAENTEVKLQTDELLLSQKILQEEISKRKKQEEAAKVCEEKFQDIFEHSLVGISIATADGKMETNEAFRQMLGYSTDELSKKKWQDITHPDDIESNQKIVESIYSGEKDFARWEKRYIHKNGSIVWVDISIVLRRDEEGKPKHLIASIIDITERWLAAQKIKESEQFFSKIFKASPIAMSIARISDGKLFEVNDVWCKVMGFSKKEAIGYSVEELKIITAADKIKIREEFLAKGYLRLLENIVTTKSGEKKTILTSAEIITIKGESYSVNLVIDITDRKRTENELLKLNRTYGVVSQINKAIVRTHDRDTLFEELCQIAVVYGKFQMAWVGLVDEETSTVNAVNFAGYENGFLTTIEKISIADTPEGHGPTGSAIREGKSFVCNDIANDISMKKWKDEALVCGYRSSIALPIKQFGKVIGAFSLYASVPGFFDNEEIMLLEEVANDISFALDAIETEKKKIEAEKALVESEGNFRNLFEQATDGIFISDQSGNYTDVNSSACLMLGYSKEELIQLNILDILAEDTIERINAEIIILKREGISRSDWKFKRKDGSVFFGEVTSKALLDGRLQAFVRDITERKQAESALKLSEEKFSMAFKSSPDLIIITSLADGRIIEVNDRVFDQTGYSHDEFIGKNTKELHFWDDPNDRKRFVDQLIQNGLVRNLEVKLRTKSGEIRDNLVSGEIIELQNEKFIIGVNHDITEIKKAELKMRINEANLSEAMKIAKLCIWEYEVATDQFTFNDQFYKIFHTSLEQEGGYTMSSSDYSRKFVHTDDYSVVSEEIQKALLSKDPNYKSTLEHRVICGDGEIKYISVNIRILKDESGRTIKTIGVNQDITERKQAEELLRENEERYRLISSVVSDYIFTSKTDDFDNLSLSWVTGAFERITGYTFDEYLSVGGWRAALHPDDIEKDNRDMEILKKNLPVISDIRTYAKSGELVWVRVYAHPVWDYQNNKLTGIYGGVKDITESKLAENAIRENEQKLKLLIEYSPASIAMFDKEMKYIIASKRYLKDYEISVTDITGRSHYEIFPEITDRWKEIHQRALKGEILRSEEDPFPRANGKIDWVRWEIHPWYEQSGEIGGIILFSEVITERKQAEIMLRDEKDRIRTILDLVGDPIFVKDNDHRITLANRSFYDMFGMDENSVIGYTLVEAVPENERQSFLKVDRSVLDTGIPDLQEEELTIGDNTKSIITRKTRFIDESGNRFLVGSIHDITERKKVEANLHESEERFRKIFEEGPMGMVMASLTTGKLFSTNKALSDMLGFTEAEFRKLTFLDFTYPDDRSKDMEAVKSLSEGQIQKYITEKRYLKKNGEVIWATLALTKIYSEADQSYYALAMIEDITERKLAEEALTNSEIRMRTLIYTVPDLIWLKDIHGVYQSCNEIFERLYSAKEADIIGKTDYDFVGRELADFFREHDRKAIEAGKPTTNEEWLTFADDGHEALLETTKTPMFDSAGNIIGILGIGHDITSRKRAEEEIVQLNEKLELRVAERTKQLEAANKELEAFSYSVSHDLRAPLRHISGFISLFLESKPSQLSSEELSYLDIVVQSAEEMGKLIDALLSFSRLNSSELHKARLDTLHLINKGLQLFESEIKSRGIQIKIDTLPDSIADRQLLSQVWINLLSNAIKYTGKKERATIEIGSFMENNETIFFIKDNGVGFNMKYAEKLFGVFQRLHKPRDFEGIGIGLANIHRIITRHGGRCWAEGEINKGATFYFSLPNEIAIMEQNVN